MFKIVLKATLCQLLWLKVAPILLSYHHLTSSSILLPRWRWGHTPTHTHSFKEGVSPFSPPTPL